MKNTIHSENNPFATQQSYHTIWASSTTAERLRQGRVFSRYPFTISLDELLILYKSVWPHHRTHFVRTFDSLKRKNLYVFVNLFNKTKKRYVNDTTQLKGAEKKVRWSCRISFKTCFLSK